MRLAIGMPPGSEDSMKNFSGHWAGLSISWLLNLNSTQSVLQKSGERLPKNFRMLFIFGSMTTKSSFIPFFTKREIRQTSKIFD